MGLTGVDKLKLSKYIKEHAIGDMYYLEMCDYLGKRGKIKDSEFLDYFTDCVVNEFSKTGKISVKYVAKLISIVGNFVAWIHEEGSIISEETLDKIRSFDQLYNDYLVRNIIDCDTDFRENCILDVLGKVNEFYPCDKSDEALVKYVVKVRELEDKIKELDKVIEDSKREYEALQNNLNKSNSKNITLNGEITSLREEVRSKKDYIRELEESLWDLKAKIIELEGSLSTVISERDELIKYKKQFEELNGEVSRLNKVISDFRRVGQQKAKDEILKSLIYQKLLVESASIKDLLSVIESNGISSDINEVSRVLREMRSNVNITNGTFSKNPTYRITKPKLVANGKFLVDVPCECKYMDVMLVSDFHIREFDKKVLDGFDMLNDYCTKNGISLILNLGDFYDGFGGRTLDYDSAVSNRKIVEESVNVIPRADGIYHGIMGGNHERNIANYGFNPIEMLVEGRDDFIDLGYYHSTICLDNIMGTIGKFDLHHPSNFSFPIDLDEDGLTIDDMGEYLDGVYSKMGRSRDDSYIDIFGHTHRNQFNYASGYCYIPPYFEGKNRRGACHLRIYFDEDTGIKYMVFMPLSISNKLVKNNEIIYQKVLSR